MNNSYPDSFRLNCVGKVPCNNNFSVCDNTNKPVVIENDKIVPDQRRNQRIEDIQNNQQGMVRRGSRSTTTHCLPYETPKRVIQNNLVDFKPVDNHSWSNQRGYGNILLATVDNQNNVCNHCGKRIVLVTEFNIDYIIPLSKGGENCLANSQALCNSCCEKKNSIDKYLQ